MTEIEEYNAAFYQSLMKCSPMGVTSAIANWAMLDRIEPLLGLLDLLESRLAKGGADELASLSKWLTKSSMLEIGASNRPLALSKRMCRQDSYHLHMAPAELLSFALWPSSLSKNGIECNETELNDVRMNYLRQVGSVLHKIQKACEDPLEINVPRPFDDFFGHCLAGLRNRKALEFLVDLKGIQWGKKLICSARRVPQMTSALDVLPVYLATLELNPCAIDVLRRRSGSADVPDTLTAMTRSFAGQASSDQYTGADKVISALQREVIDSLDKRECSLHNALKILYQGAPEESQGWMMQHWLTEALQKNTGAHHKGAMGVIENLWSWTVPDFAQMVERRAKHKDHPGIQGDDVWTPYQVQSLVCAAASSACTPILQAFRPTVERMAREAPSGQIGYADVDLAHQACLGVTGDAAGVKPDAFLSTVRFLADCGCNFAKIRFTGDDTILHSMARRASSGTLFAMVELIDQGCDPQAKNAKNWQPSSYLSKDLKPKWDMMLRSHKAKTAARHALNDIFAAPT